MCSVPPKPVPVGKVPYYYWAPQLTGGHGLIWYELMKLLGAPELL